MKLTAVAPWFGSNRMLAARVGEIMGSLKWIGVPFAGGMSELFHLRARTVVANDLHRHIINLARVIADPQLGPALYRRLRRMVLHPDELSDAQFRCEIKEGMETRGFEPDLEWATDYFVCAWMSRSHSAGSSDEFSSGMSLRWNANGGDSATRYFNAARSIPAWRRALSHCSFTCIDAIDFIGKCRDEPGNGIYCDPPFPGPGDRYKHRVDENFQRRLCDVVGRFSQCRVVMRFYDHALIREIYREPKWCWNHLRGRTQANKEAPEVILTNWDSAMLPGMEGAAA
jgi:DNA adenine methylase